MVGGVVTAYLPSLAVASAGLTTGIPSAVLSRHRRCSPVEKRLGRSLHETETGGFPTPALLSLEANPTCLAQSIGSAGYYLQHKILAYANHLGNKSYKWLNFNNLWLVISGLWFVSLVQVADRSYCHTSI